MPFIFCEIYRLEDRLEHEIDEREGEADANNLPSGLKTDLSGEEGTEEDPEEWLINVRLRTQARKAPKVGGLANESRAGGSARSPVGAGRSGGGWARVVLVVPG